MKKKLFLCFIISLFHSKIYSQYVGNDVAPNIGISINILGPIFGIYSLGISTFLSSQVQIGLTGSYYSTRNSEPQAEGSLIEYRMTYYFSGIQKNGITLALSGGFESIEIKQESDQWKKYEDPIGGVIPGYNWLIGKNLHLLAGLYFGYQFGSFQIKPEISFIYFF
ncbi:hypothetical protein [Fluviispira sanaruensis]|uniref:Outer membrane protein beta-barrel domain-containing protein n=1 Tax=Fluviispira sanaruensis TaxID=2493639 RepID=A0A4P2VJW4_FLUSA|nr:hypothetical protein [Fluviispira sanaruensis]BBH52838.1 hypothetical protein JCM31447_12810 [Fluviispira sanaruensis]